MLFINGESSESKILAGNRSFSYGEGVFETMRFALKDGVVQVIALDYHMARLKLGFDTLRFPQNEHSFSDITTQLAEALSESSLQQGMIKLHVSFNADVRGYARKKAQIQVVISVSKLPSTHPALNNIHACLKLCETKLAKQPLLAQIKHCNRLESVLAAEELNTEHEGLLFDYDGHLIEAISSNVFIVKDNQLITSDLTECGVAGTVRARIIDHFDVVIQKISKSDLLKAEAVFISNALVLVWQVAAIEGKHYQIDHPVFSRVNQYFQAQY